MQAPPTETVPIASACPCCGEELRAGWTHWHRQCTRCGYEQAVFSSPDASGQQDAGRLSDTAQLDEGLRREALYPLRTANFQQVLAQLAPLLPKHAGPLRVLDVGCAHGWFLEACRAQASDWQLEGLEPDAAIAAEARAAAHRVTVGYFPEALAPEARYDLIAFHDVFEHLPNVAEALQACRHHLHANGLLVLNLPSARGVFYRLARSLARLGWEAPLRRLWQEGMPSPHLHYFHAENLSQLLRKHQLQPTWAGTLPSIRREGLMARLRYDPRSAWMAPLLGPVLWLLIPWMQRLPADICVVIARKPGDAGDGI